MTPQKPTIAIKFYRALTNSLAWLAPHILRHRANLGKEDPKRINERLGQNLMPRPEMGENRLIWLHGASVGETMIGLHVAYQLRQLNSNLRFLFTSQTLASAHLLERQIDKCDIYQFAPIDSISATRGFIENWKPDMAVFIEGEIWPNLLDAVREKNIPSALINARMTTDSIKTWLRFYKSAEYLFAPFDFISPANKMTKNGLLALGGRNMSDAGNLKIASPPPILNENIIKEIGAKIKNRPVWLCASSHEGEEAIILTAQNILASLLKNTLLIIAPRHLKRAENIMLECAKLGLNVKRRSIGEYPDETTSVYLWDTMGELGNAMALSKATLVGGSLVRNIGGHNPIEPAQIGSAIISGPYVHNFADIYEQLESDKGALIIHNLEPNFIALKIAELLTNTINCIDMTQRARLTIARSKGALQQTINGLIAILEKSENGGKI